MEPTSSSETLGLLPPVVTQMLAAIEAFNDHVGSRAWTLQDSQVAALWSVLASAQARLVSGELGIVAEANTRGLALRAGATSTANWWAFVTHRTRAETRRLTKTAAGLADRPLVAAALSEGRLSADQAAVIVDGIAALPTDLVDDATRTEAEEYLIAKAAHFDAKALRVMVDKILDVVAPEVAEAHEARVLDRQERDAQAAAKFTMRPDGHGKVNGRFTLSEFHGAILDKALQALVHAQKDESQEAGAGDGTAKLPLPHRMGLAFGDYIESHSPHTLPKTGGGVSATVVVTMGFAELTAGLKAAQLDTGQRISAALARRLACQAGLVPAVLGTGSVAMDMGRRARLFTPSQRLALGIRDGGCTVDGCDRPPGVCHAHHDNPWVPNGHTDLANGRLLCPRHHTLIHDPRATITKVGSSGGGAGDRTIRINLRT